MAAHEISQVTHRFHRYGLVKQLQSLIVFNAKTAAEPRRIGRKAIVQISCQSAQLLAQLGNVRSEMGEIRGNRQRALSPDKEPRRLSLRFFHPEHLGQRHGLVVACVMEHAQDHRIAVLVAQAHRLGRAGDFVALGFVVPQHVGTQRSFLAVRTGRLVVGNAVGRHQ